MKIFVLIIILFFHFSKQQITSCGYNSECDTINKDRGTCVEHTCNCKEGYYGSVCNVDLIGGAVVQSNPCVLKVFYRSYFHDIIHISPDCRNYPVIDFVDWKAEHIFDNVNDTPIGNIIGKNVTFFPEIKDVEYNPEYITEQ